MSIEKQLVEAPYMTSAIRREASEEITRLRNALTQSIENVQRLQADHLAARAADKAEIERMAGENEALKGQLHEEIAANLAFREKGGALADEDMPTFCDRLIARIAELEARQPEADLKEAERYRWIKVNADVMFREAQWIPVGGGKRIHSRLPSSNQLDDAINGAITEAKETNHGR